jgi:3-oxoacyl-[acyl-carrier protein] reductase
VRATAEHFGGIDVLINNAGAAQGGAFLELPDQAWLENRHLKLFGYIRVAREVFPHLARRGGGRVVNVIGIAGVPPIENYMIGGAANAALLNFTKAPAGGRAAPGHREAHGTGASARIRSLGTAAPPARSGHCRWRMGR